MKMSNHLIAGLLALAFLAPGSAFARSDGRCGNCGTVVAVQPVQHKDSHLGAGTALGAMAGGLLGHTVGKGDGRTAATVGGAVAGGAIGHQIEKNQRDDRYGWRISIDMDNGRRVTVTQRDNPDIRDGDRVRVANGRVERY